jgi:hypothetical protein
MARENGRRLSRVVMLVATATMLALAPSSHAVGLLRPEQPARCTCGALDADVAAADAMFVGTPTAIALEVAGPAGSEQLWSFDVEQHLAGPQADVINVSGGGSLSNCRAEFAAGETVGIVAFWRSGHLATSLCGVVEPAALLEATDSDRSTPDRLPVTAIGVVVILALATAGAVWRHRRA